MTGEMRSVGFWSRVPVVVRAVIGGWAIGLIAANLWPMFLISLGMPLAALVEIVFLTLYVWWAAGGGPPRSWKSVRADYFRVGPLSAAQWFWGVVAAMGLAATVNASLVVLFRLVPFPAAAFHHGYDFSFIPSRGMQWAAVVVSALSAGVCEETGFRGYMQRPIEKRHGPLIAILISSLFFTLPHLTKDWALIGMVPVIFGAGLLLGALARASGTLVFCILGHWIMDVGLFAYWWTQIAGTFPQRPIAKTGIDRTFYIECIAFAAALTVVLWATVQLRKLRTPDFASRSERHARAAA
jgi:membrane protease YdiL (CAAX protease family)